MKRNFTTISLLAGPIGAGVAILVLPPMLDNAGGVPVPIELGVRTTIAITVWMAIWWITEAIPMPVTALLPLILFPILGINDFKVSATAYAHPLIFLFLGGFLVSIAVQKWGLHRRFAVSILRRVGDRPSHLVGGFMFVTALLSMWLSNTATTIMMLPIALSIVAGRPKDDDFSKCLLIGIAYSASIGGMATLIGTPPNLYIASYFSEVLKTEIGFLQWMMIGLPCSLLLLPSAWFYLTKVHFSLPTESSTEQDKLVGDGLVWRDLDRGARTTLIIFAALVASWIMRPLLAEVEIFGFFPFGRINDAGIALLAALALFAVPVGLSGHQSVLTWEDTRDLPWGTLLLFGGGLSLAATIKSSGADEIIGLWISGVPTHSAIFVSAIIVAVIIVLTELTSNIATTATLVPVFAAAAPLLGLNVEVLVPMIALAASCAFMLPVATPPNTIVFGSGYIRATDMASAGAVMNILALLTISVIGYAIIPAVMSGQ
jgi:sodium-dependent dicarboxylate transporter 2/3/5